jgi:hypothetical protein
MPPVCVARATSTSRTHAPRFRRLRARTRRAWRPVVGGALAIAVLASCLGTDRPFRDSSAFNRPIPSSPVIDPRSRSIVSYLSSGTSPAVANIGAYGVPVFDASASTPRATVTCWEDWGTCALERTSVPIPTRARPSSGSDGAMVVIDWSARKVYEFYRARRVSPTQWTTAWGGVVAFDGAGTPGQAVGSGISRLAGVVRGFEMLDHAIPHALVFSTDNACRSGPRYPASKSDGHSTRDDCIPEGARIQLDPAIDVNRIPGITRAERTIARALQRYGAYAIDNGGAKMAFIFEVPEGGTNPYCEVGLCRDYQSLSHIPWSRLRVLRSWTGT